ncbi:MAG: helix-turn-helix transcriptional regulator [Bacilli bacterium]|nr:helix-turn-helix transcriptional regulator [Bacilli bacterium]
MNRKELGHRLKELRKSKGYSQYQLAELMGYKDHSTLAKVETGVNDITVETLYKYASILNVNVSDILSFNTENYVNNIQELERLLNDIEEEQANGAKYYSIEELDLALRKILGKSDK